jgi:hypothetical protein
MRLEEIKLEPILDTLRIEKIDDNIYFTSPVYKNRISNSRLGLLNPNQGGSPEKFFEGFTDQGFVAAFQLGSAVHELILQNHLFELAPNIGKPTAKLGAVADELFKVFLGEAVTKEHLINAD